MVQKEGLPDLGLLREALAWMWIINWWSSREIGLFKVNMIVILTING